jgi:VWFA-related protein
MKFRRIVCTFAGALTAATAVSAQEPEPPITFRSSVEVVTIHATVRDRRGRPLRGLRPADFVVSDNGERQPIVSFHADSDAPVSVAFLVDVSGSMAIANKMSLASEVSKTVIGAMRHGVDEAALYTFDSRLTEQQPFTRELGSIGGALEGSEPFGTTSLYDAVAQAASKVQASAARHAAIVVITDGFDTSSALTAADVSGIASSIDVPVYVVATVAAADREVIAAPRDEEHYGADLRDLAAWSGGHVLVAGSRVEAQVAASTLLEELRHQYVLGIEAGGTGGWRRLDVRVSRDRHHVRARSGYFGTP